MAKSMPPTEEVIEQLHVYMDEAIEMLEKGEYVELMGLNERVENLCKQVTKLPVDDAIHYRDDLSELIERLDEVKRYMELHRDRLGADVKGLEGNKNAAKAYQKSSHLPGANRPTPADEK